MTSNLKRKKGKNKMIVYIYREYDGTEYLTEEHIKVFESKDRALAHWKSEVGEWFDEPFDPTDESLILDYEADLKYNEEEGSALYRWENTHWVVTPQVVC